MRVDEWRTRQHDDLIRVEVEAMTDPNEIIITTIGSDSDDDDMHCYVRLNVADAIQLHQALRQAIGVVVVREGGRDATN